MRFHRNDHTAHHGRPAMGPYPSQEPCFLLLGRDIYAPGILRAYAAALQEVGEATDEEIAEIENWAEEMEGYQVHPQGDMDELAFRKPEGIPGSSYLFKGYRQREEPIDDDGEGDGSDGDSGSSEVAPLEDDDGSATAAALLAPDAVIRFPGVYVYTGDLTPGKVLERWRAAEAPGSDAWIGQGTTELRETLPSLTKARAKDLTRGWLRIDFQDTEHETDVLIVKKAFEGEPGAVLVTWLGEPL